MSNLPIKCIDEFTKMCQENASYQHLNWNIILFSTTLFSSALCLPWKATPSIKWNLHLSSFLKFIPIGKMAKGQIYRINTPRREGSELKYTLREKSIEIMIPIFSLKRNDYLDKLHGKRNRFKKSKNWNNQIGKLDKILKLIEFFQQEDFYQ